MSDIFRINALDKAMELYKLIIAIRDDYNVVLTGDVRSGKTLIAEKLVESFSDEINLIDKKGLRLTSNVNLFLTDYIEDYSIINLIDEATIFRPDSCIEAIIKAQEAKGKLVFIVQQREDFIFLLRSVHIKVRRYGTSLDLML